MTIAPIMIVDKIQEIESGKLSNVQSILTKVPQWLSLITEKQEVIEPMKDDTDDKRVSKFYCWFGLSKLTVTFVIVEQDKPVTK